MGMMLRSCYKAAVQSMTQKRALQQFLFLLSLFLSYSLNFGLNFSPVQQRHAPRVCMCFAPCEMLSRAQSHHLSTPKGNPSRHSPLQCTFQVLFQRALLNTQVTRPVRHTGTSLNLQCQLSKVGHPEAVAPQLHISSVVCCSNLQLMTHKHCATYIKRLNLSTRPTKKMLLCMCVCVYLFFILNLPPLTSIELEPGE